MSHAAGSHGPSRVLLVEDSEEHAKLTSSWLRQDGHERYEVVWVERLSVALDRLEREPFDVILLDLGLPDSDRIETFRAARDKAPATPIVLMTGIGDERLALQAVQEGAQDYLVKGDIDGRVLVRALDYAIERRRADEVERRALEAQRLESLALVAGGVAHELNNLLVVILGNATLAASELPQNHPIRHYLLEIENASERAARLANQMLAYSGRGGFVRRAVDMREPLQQACDALNREMPHGVRVEMVLPADPVIVQADESQLVQLVWNLVTNAAEAASGHPSLVEVRLEAVTAGADDFARAYLSPTLPVGQYARLDVVDTGSGMTSDVQAHIFEPFFTTRLAGRGLGLPAALGIVRGFGGAIAVESSTGVGTTVTVWLPIANGRA